MHRSISHVFLSYARQDEAIAEQIVSILEELEVDYFRDDKNIAWGQPISQAVGMGLSESQALLLVLSADSLKSLWVPFELGQAVACGKPVLPVLVGGYEMERCPAYLADLKYITSMADLRK